MTHNRLLVFDAETVPDLPLLPPDFDPKDGVVPKALHCRVVAIAFLLAEIGRNENGEVYRVTAWRAGGTAFSTEAELLGGFWQLIDRESPRLVTWNGKGFDLPVLKLRSMIHGLRAGCLYSAGDKWANYTTKFAPDWHCDLMEQLSDYRATTALKLNEIAAGLGIPLKPASGKDVGAMMIDDVRAYCEADVGILFAAYLRWQVLTGRCTRAAHDEALATMEAAAPPPAAEHFFAPGRWHKNGRLSPA